MVRRALGRSKDQVRTTSVIKLRGHRGCRCLRALRFQGAVDVLSPDADDASIDASPRLLDLDDCIGFPPELKMVLLDFSVRRGLASIVVSW